MGRPKGSKNKKSKAGRKPARVAKRVARQATAARGGTRAGAGRKSVEVHFNAINAKLDLLLKNAGLVVAAPVAQTSAPVEAALAALATRAENAPAPAAAPAPVKRKPGRPPKVKPVDVDMPAPTFGPPALAPPLPPEATTVFTAPPVAPVAVQPPALQPVAVAAVPQVIAPPQAYVPPAPVPVPVVPAVIAPPYVAPQPVVAQPTFTQPPVTFSPPAPIAPAGYIGVQPLPTLPQQPQQAPAQYQAPQSATDFDAQFRSLNPNAQKP